jgi:hypothetical protein
MPRIQFRLIRFGYIQSRNDIAFDTQDIVTENKLNAACYSDMQFEPISRPESIKRRKRQPRPMGWLSVTDGPMLGRMMIEDLLELRERVATSIPIVLVIPESSNHEEKEMYFDSLDSRYHNFNYPFDIQRARESFRQIPCCIVENTIVSDQQELNNQIVLINNVVPTRVPITWHDITSRKVWIFAEPRTFVFEKDFVYSFSRFTSFRKAGLILQTLLEEVAGDKFQPMHLLMVYQSIMVLSPLACFVF